MEFLQLRCFVTVAEMLHFGRAAQHLEMLPASLGRQIRLLEERLGVRLLSRTTRNVSLTEAGSMLLPEALEIIRRVEQLEAKLREHKNQKAALLRIGAIDSAAAGLLPQLLPRFRELHPEVVVQLIEQKTIRLLPKILSGHLDIAIVRPPETPDPRLEFHPLFHETAVVACPEGHSLAEYEEVDVHQLVDQPLIVPDRKSRPHSHDLSMQLFIEAGLSARVVQIAEEKQTIVNLVGRGMGIAIVPRWASRLGVKGVRFVSLKVTQTSTRNKLALAACWMRDTKDPTREAFMSLLSENLSSIAATA
ncbi:LysR family transcriptional regulator [Hoeflea sp.]|uniref:LysR family transcriptional regulator n=1 Tax=Hoeflea sp. TaxID=1940281 RepID=UPI003B51BC2F